MLAGHETTAHSLAFILTLLAIYPEHQQKLFDEADAVFGDREASYDDYTSLPYSLATMQEALRLYSPVQLIPKIALEDTHLPAHTTDGSHTPISLFVPKGARMGLAASGLHFNRNDRLPSSLHTEADRRSYSGVLARPCRVSTQPLHRHG